MMKKWMLLGLAILLPFNMLLGEQVAKSNRSKYIEIVLSFIDEEITIASSDEAKQREHLSKRLKIIEEGSYTDYLKGICSEISRACRSLKEFRDYYEDPRTHSIPSPCKAIQGYQLIQLQGVRNSLSSKMYSNLPYKKQVKDLIFDLDFVIQNPLDSEAIKDLYSKALALSVDIDNKTIDSYTWGDYFCMGYFIFVVSVIMIKKALDLAGCGVPIIAGSISPSTDQISGG